MSGVDPFIDPVPVALDRLPATAIGGWTRHDPPPVKAMGREQAGEMALGGSGGSSGESWALATLKSGVGDGRCCAGQQSDENEGHRDSPPRTRLRSLAEPVTRSNQPSCCRS